MVGGAGLGGDGVEAGTGCDEGADDFSGRCGTVELSWLGADESAGVLDGADCPGSETSTVPAAIEGAGDSKQIPRIAARSIRSPRVPRCQILRLYEIQQENQAPGFDKAD